MPRKPAGYFDIQNSSIEQQTSNSSWSSANLGCLLYVAQSIVQSALKQSGLSHGNCRWLSQHL